MFYDSSVLHFFYTVEFLGSYIINLKTISLYTLRLHIAARLCMQIANLKTLLQKYNLVRFLIQTES